jgi:gas vesicle protein
MKQLTEYGKFTVAGLAGFGLGALAMFLFDPESGRRRRSMAREKTAAAANDVVNAAGSKARDLQNRAKGLAHHAASAAGNVLPWSGPERRVPPRGTLAQRKVG